MRGIDPHVNKACAAASITCLEIGFTGVGNATIVSSDMTTDAEHKRRSTVAMLLIAAQYNPFDISVEKPGAIPYEYEAAFLN